MIKRKRREANQQQVQQLEDCGQACDGMSEAEIDEMLEESFRRAIRRHLRWELLSIPSRKNQVTFENLEIGREFDQLRTKEHNERLVMKILKVMLVLLFLIAGTLMAQQRTVKPQLPEASVTPLMSKDLRDVPGKEVSMITVEYPPGSIDPIHRHNAHAFVYVLEGSIVMQVKGGKEVTLTPGQTFYEGPDDVHIVGRNASNTKPAKFVVLLIKDKGAPVLVPVPE
jgi:quercetin dioxygenase-like cupin family protein